MTKVKRMKTIHKYQIKELKDRQIITMSHNAIILSAQVQGGVMCFWALVDTEEIRAERYVYIFGTGMPIPANYDLSKLALKHIGTLQQGGFVWHLFID